MAHSCERVEDSVPCFGFCLGPETPPKTHWFSFTFHSLWGPKEAGQGRHFGSPVLCGNFMPFAPCNFPGCRQHELLEFVLFIPAVGPNYIYLFFKGYLTMLLAGWPGISLAG